LLPDPHVDGLQIQAGGREWLPVAAVDGAFVINLGDLMARWTNDRWVSTLHRVVENASGKRRQSIAFFQQPDWDAEIACIPTCLEPGHTPQYAPVRSGPYLMRQFTRTVAARA
jgi:isopenicillin N synthase-like dioxygenase